MKESGYFLKQLFKSIVSSAIRYKKTNKKNILLFATRRGGSTWIMELLSSVPGILYMDHCFSIYRSNPYLLKYLPIQGQQLVTIDNQQDFNKIKTYTSLLLTGKLKPNPPWRFWKREFNFINDRLVLKITDAKPLINFFDENFDVQIILFLRHPIPNVLSIINNGWGDTLRSYVTNRAFLETHLSDKQIDIARKIYKADNLFERHLLNWILENLVPLRSYKENDWLVLTYEELVNHPESSIERFCEYLNIEKSSINGDYIHKKSKSTKKLSSNQRKEDLDKYDKVNLLNFWQKKISDEDKKSFDNLFDLFEIHEYNSNSSLPSIKK